MLAQHGPAELISRTRTIKLSDPHGERWKRGKVSDDATVVYCTGF
ncbi:hypothetical protein AB0M43_30715 [Longispora sp. NPDC051575]